MTNSSTTNRSEDADDPGRTLGFGHFRLAASSRVRSPFYRLHLLLLLAALLPGCRRSDIQIGAKLGPESAILQQIATQSLKNDGFPAVAHRTLDGTSPCWTALLSGDLDAYPEYTGTISQQILNHPAKMTDDQLRAELSKQGIGMTGSIGFNDTYAIGMPADRAAALGIKTISDLARHPEIRFGFSNEFTTRPDGWPGLKSAYGLPQENPKSMFHAVAYAAMKSGAIDAADLYSTDAEIAANHLVVLEDDRHFFPEYNAVYVYRLDLNNRFPGAAEVLEKMRGKIDDGKIRSYNTMAKVDGVAESSIAAGFLNQGSAVRKASPWSPRVLLDFTGQHLFLVTVSLAMAIAAGIPLGIVAAERPRVGQAVTAVVAVIYTIPSLALLVFMIPLLGTGRVPAIAALFLYSLLPIVRGTLTGLQGISPALRESADVLGLPTWTRLRRIGLPLALPSIMAGLKTAAVLNIGTATLGGVIAAGGYGDPILTGISLGNTSMILSGAVPAAVMALIAQWGFDLLEKAVVPRGLRRPAG